MRERRSYIVLVSISVMLSVLTFFLALHQTNMNANRLETEQAANNRKFCDVINSFIVTKVPKPADPKANPSRERNWELYIKFVRLDNSLGCHRLTGRGTSEGTPRVHSAGGHLNPSFRICLRPRIEGTRPEQSPVVSAHYRLARPEPKAASACESES